jgi:hypothetical protein
MSQIVIVILNYTLISRNRHCVDIGLYSVRKLFYEKLYKQNWQTEHEGYSGHSEKPLHATVTRAATI